MVVPAVCALLLGATIAAVLPRGPICPGSPEACLASNLATARETIELYRTQHGGRLPTAAIVSEMLITTDADGTLRADRAGACGPYLREMFLNPIDGRSSVEVVSTMPAQPTRTGGWIYSVKDGRFRANLPGAGPSLTRFFDL